MTISDKNLKNNTFIPISVPIVVHVVATNDIKSYLWFRQTQNIYEYNHRDNQYITTPSDRN